MILVKKLLVTIVTVIAVNPLLGVKNFVLISAPGSGKGTFSQYLVEKHGYVQVCPGDIFRSEISAQTELGKKIEPVVERGDYVDEDIVCTLIADNLKQIIKENKYFIIDGFPRSEFSFQFLYQFFLDNNLINDVCFLQLVAHDNTCINRILGRQICTQCFKVYNIVSAQPKKLNVCDDCGIELTARKADTKEIAQKRLEFFHEHAESLMDCAAGLYETKKIVTECSVQELHTIYDNLLE